MANQRQIEELQNEFPEMTFSMLGDVLKNYGNNTQKAMHALKGFNDTQQAEKERKIKELEEMFKDKLPREFILRTLEEANYDVDTAILPLFNKCDEIAQERKRKQDMEKRKKREEEEAKRRKAEMEKQVHHLMEAFKNIPQAKVQQILDANEGDIEETTMQLLSLVQQEEDEALAKQKAAEEEKRRRKEEEEQKKKAELQNKDIKINALKGQFLDLTDAEVIGALESSNWDIKTAYAQLLNYSISKKTKDLKDLFQSFDQNDIAVILEAHAYDKMKAAKELMTKREARRMDEENRIKEEFKKQEETKKQQETPKHQAEPPKPSPNVLEKSIIMGEMLEAEVAASQIFMKKEEERKKKEEQEEAKQQFKKNLERVIEDQVRWNSNNMPGLVPPPLPKQIDAMKDMKKSLPDIDQPAPQNQAPVQAPHEQPSPGSSQIIENKECTVEVTAQPNLVDTGNTINVEWAIASGQSSNRDWIGLFALDKANKEYVTYQWTGKGLPKGTLSFSAPVMGEYEFRYFPNGSYQHISRSNKIRVGPQFEVTAVLDKENKKMIAKWKQVSGNAYPKAWIGLYEKSQTNNNNFISYQNVGKSNEIAFAAPFKPREYEFRFFTNSYVDIARSNAILIEGQDSMSATYNNGNLNVKLNLVSVDPYYESAWLGVYFTHETDNRQWRRYKYIASRSDDVQFSGPKTPGEYEVRMFANKTYDLLLKSNKFVIPFGTK